MLLCQQLRERMIVGPLVAHQGVVYLGIFRLLRMVRVCFTRSNRLYEGSKFVLAAKDQSFHAQRRNMHLTDEYSKKNR